MTKKVQVIFPDGEWQIIKSLKGSMANTDSELIRAIVTSWLSEKSLLSSSVKSRLLERQT
jgi:hypothetical protein